MQSCFFVLFLLFMLIVSTHFLLGLDSLYDHLADGCVWLCAFQLWWLNFWNGLTNVKAKDKALHNPENSGTFNKSVIEYIYIKQEHIRTIVGIFVQCSEYRPDDQFRKTANVQTTLIHWNIHTVVGR